MADSTRPAVLAALPAEVTALLGWVEEAPALDLATAERRVGDAMRALGAQLLEAGLAARGTGKDGPRRPGACGALAGCEGDRAKEVPTLVGWIAVRRAYYWCAACGAGQAPLDARLGLARASPSPGVRRLLCRFGARLPFAQAAEDLAEAAGVQTSASTGRGVTEAVGARREPEVATAGDAAWRDGLPPGAAPAPGRLYVALDGTMVPTVGGQYREAKVGVVRPEVRDAAGAPVPAASSVASFAPAEAFGRRLALEAHRRGLEAHRRGLEAHRRGLEAAEEGVVLGDGARHRRFGGIWNLAAEHFPPATRIVDGYHASERVWELGRARYGAGTAKTRTWVERQLKRLAKGEVQALVAAWRRRKCAGAAAAVRDEQVGYVTNRASGMAYAQYRARRLDIGSGMVEGGAKALIGAREKGPGMRWTVPGAPAVAPVRVRLCNDQWATYDPAA